MDGWEVPIGESGEKPRETKDLIHVGVRSSSEHANRGTGYQSALVPIECQTLKRGPDPLPFVAAGQRVRSFIREAPWVTR